MIHFIYSADASETAGGELAANDQISDTDANEPSNHLSVTNDAEEEPLEEEKTDKAADTKTTDDAKTINSKGYTPAKDAEIKAVVDRVCASWKANPTITLGWTTQEEMESIAKDFSDELAQRKSAGSERPSITSELAQQNADMDMGVTEVKVYIEKKFKKKNATVQFPRYGIEKVNNTYILPRDQSQRLLNLDLMIAAIAKDGFGDEEYGTAFWTDMKKKFGDTLAEASSTDGTVSGKVSGKDVSRRQLVKIMTALRFVLKGNYPDTYPSVYREWGWRKQ